MQKKSLWILLSVLGLSLSLIVVLGLGALRYANTIPSMGNIGGSEDMTSSYMLTVEDSKGYGLSEISGVSPSDVVFETRIKKNGYVNLLVSNIDKSYAQLRDLVDEKNGSLLNSYDSGEGNDRYVQVQVKVESKYFEEVMDNVLAMDGELESSSIDTQDITEQYLDVKARLTNLRNTEAQLTAILKSADTVSDTLAVYKELTSIRSEIEVYEGQLKYMDSQTDYSYITVVFAVNKEGLNIAQDQWKPIGEFKLALNALVGVIKGLGNVIIWLIVFSPLVLVPVGIVMLVKRQKSRK